MRISVKNRNNPSVPHMQSFGGGRLLALLCCWLLASTPAQAAEQQAASPELIARGAYLARAAGCAICHTNKDKQAQAYAGGRALHTEFGTFYAPNITPDKATGIGTWSERDFVQALHQGIRPDGSQLYPVFPYTSYTRLTNADARALWAYLQSLPPIHQANRPHRLRWFAPPRFSIWFWKMLYFKPGRYQPEPGKSKEWNRGAYLATAAGHCVECHSPRNLLGGLKDKLEYAGAENKPEDFVAPNITPDPQTGIADWSRGDIAEYLQSGLSPDGDTAGSIMAEFIDKGFSHLRKQDLLDIATFIKSLPPIKHRVGHKKPAAKQARPAWD